MEADRRPFQSVNVGFASAQDGESRYSWEEAHRAPPTAGWRCNLTALSQRYNLYFMASRAGVVVFEPEFPFQRLKQKPALYIPPVLANPRARGYLDSHTSGRNPHDINHLIVGNLGSEEILLVSTDSGNVTAYHTKAIHDALRKDPYKFSTDGRSDLVGLRAFFSHWVYESAWGLAIHSQGRMIAVSANVPGLIPNDDLSAKVTVFAFALTDTNSGMVEDDDNAEDGADLHTSHSDWQDWNPSTSDGHIPTRDRNYKITLGGNDGHQTNIPSISFVNSREDTDGAWLLSCDIYGDTKCWQIWRGLCHGTWDFSEGSARYRRAVQRRTDGGWMIAALDPQAFRPTDSLETFCGNRRVPQYFGYMGGSESYDITATVRMRMPGRSQRHPLHPEESEDENDAIGPDETAARLSDSEIEEEDHRSTQGSSHEPASAERLHHPASQPQTDSSAQSGHDTLTQDESVAGLRRVAVEEADMSDVLDAFNAADIIDSDVASEADDDANLDDTTLSDLEQAPGDDSDATAPFLVDPLIDAAPFSPASTASSSNSRSHQTNRTSVEVEIGPPLLTSSPEVSSSSVPKRITPTKRPRRTALADHTARKPRIPRIPTLHLSESHLRLINLPDSRSPHLFCANILKQDLPEVYGAHHPLSRLNMLQSVPELGIIVIGSQLGRVAVCTLTKYAPTGILGLRVDWILPTRRQEKRGMRPKRDVLLGIAVGPIQGRERKGSDSSEQDDAEARGHWARDRVIDGVDTTFDTRVMPLSPTASHRANNHAVDSSPSDTDDPAPYRRESKGIRLPKKKQRRKHTLSSKSSSSSAATTEHRPWPDKPPKQDPSWVAVEGTRRYRLMMTYSDLTVLTYELSRGIERDEINLSYDGEYSDEGESRDDDDEETDEI